MLNLKRSFSFFGAKTSFQVRILLEHFSNLKQRIFTPYCCHKCEHDFKFQVCMVTNLKRGFGTNRLQKMRKSRLKFKHLIFTRTRFSCFAKQKPCFKFGFVFELETMFLCNKNRKPRSKFRPAGLTHKVDFDLKQGFDFCVTKNLVSGQN